MAKPGRHPARFITAGLLTAFFFLTPGALYADLNSPQVTLTVAPLEADIGSTLSVELTVTGVDLHDVSLEVLNVPSALLLSGSRRGRGLVENSSAEPAVSAMASVITFEYQCAAAGEWKLGPFMVTIAGKQTLFPARELRVRQPVTESIGSLRWKSIPANVYAGEPVTLILEGRLTGTPSEIKAEPSVDTLLELIRTWPYSAGADGYTLLAEYRWTALRSGRYQLPRAVLVYSENGQPVTLESEPVVVVAQKERSASRNGGGQSVVSPVLEQAFAPLIEEAGPTAAPPVEPAALQALGDGGGGGLDGELNAIRSDWRSGRYAAALAGIRRAEYRSLFQSSWTKARLEAEAALALEHTHPVPPGGRKSLILILAVLFGISGVLLYLAGIKRPVVRYAALLPWAVFLVMAFFALTVYIRDRHEIVVCSSGNLLTVPDPASSVTARIAEGESALVHSAAGEWLYVETVTGQRGWVVSSRVFFYRDRGASHGLW